jgi:hypothetical protein
LIAFVGAHVVLAAVAVGVVWAGTRLSPRLHRLAARLHRPTLRHVGLMLASAVGVAGLIHFGFHGLGELI